MLEGTVIPLPVEVIGKGNGYFRLRRGRLVKDDEPVRLGIRQRPQQHRVDYAKDGGIRADTEPERDDRDEGEARRLQQCAQCKFKITDHSLIWLDDPAVAQLYDPFAVRGVFFGMRHLHYCHSLLI
jgi:hypothetical protein